MLGSQYETEDRQVVTGADCEPYGIGVSIETREETSGVEFRLIVRNASGKELSEVVFPDWELETMPGEPGFTMPIGPGWWQPFDVLDEREHITWNYPVFGAMQWVDYCNKDSGIYIGVHDKTPLLKLFTVGRRNDRPWVRVRFTDIRLMPGETFALPPVVMCEHSGDWREGARLYRAWAESWMEKPTGAEWYDAAPAWSWFGLKGQHSAKPDKVYSDAPASAKANSELGVRLLNVGGWTAHGHDTHYPDYFAGESMGGAKELVSAVQAIHEAGLRISLYTNGRIADPQGTIGEMPGWLDWTCKASGRNSLAAMQRLHANFNPASNPDAEWNTGGSTAVESYGSVDFAVMCPGSAQWRELFMSRIEDMARDYGIDGTFIDQICGCWAYPCYSNDHDHTRPNASWGGYLTMLKQLRRRVRAINPEFQMSTEGVCDILGQYFDVQQGHNDWDTQVGTKSRPLPELYSYTFPWYTVNTGFAGPNNYYYLKLAHAVGNGLDLCDLASDGLERLFRRWVTRIMEWRKRYADTLRRGEFLGSLECDNPHYLACAYRKGNDLVVTTAWVPYRCEQVKPAEVKLRLRDCVVRSARLFMEDGEREVDLEEDGAGTVIRVPLSEIAVLEAIVDSVPRSCYSATSTPHFSSPSVKRQQEG